MLEGWDRSEVQVRARLAGRDCLVPEDIDAKKLCGRKTRVGF